MREQEVLTINADGKVIGDPSVGQGWLRRAAKEGNRKQIESLLAMGIESVPDEGGYDALCWAIHEGHSELTHYLITTAEHQIKLPPDQALVLLGKVLWILVSGPYTLNFAEEKRRGWKFFKELERTVNERVRTTEDFFNLMQQEFYAPQDERNAGKNEIIDERYNRYLFGYLHENGFFARCLASASIELIFKFLSCMYIDQISAVMAILVKQNKLREFEQDKDLFKLLDLCKGRPDGSWILFEKLLERKFFSSTLKTRDDLFRCFHYLNLDQARALVDSLDKANLLETIARTAGDNPEPFTLTEYFPFLPFGQFLILTAQLSEEQKKALFSGLSNRCNDKVYLRGQIFELTASSVFYYYDSGFSDHYLSIVSRAQSKPKSDTAKTISRLHMERKKAKRATVLIRSPDIIEMLKQLPTEAYPYYLGNLKRAIEGTVSSAEVYVDFHQRAAGNPELQEWIFHYAMEPVTMRRFIRDSKDLGLVFSTFTNKQVLFFVSAYPKKMNLINNLEKFRMLIFGIKDTNRKAEILELLKQEKFLLTFLESYNEFIRALRPVDSSLPTTAQAVSHALLERSPEGIKNLLDQLAQTAGAGGDSVLLELFVMKDFRSRGSSRFLVPDAEEKIEAIFLHPEYRRCVLSFVTLEQLISFPRREDKTQAFRVLAKGRFFKEYIKNKDVLYDTLKRLDTINSRVILSDVVNSDSWETLLASKYYTIKPSSEDDEIRTVEIFVSVISQAVGEISLWQTVSLLRSLDEKLRFDPIFLSDVSLERKEKWKQELALFRELYKRYSLGPTHGFLSEIEGEEGRIGSAYWKIVCHALSRGEKSATNMALAQMQKEHWQQQEKAISAARGAAFFSQRSAGDEVPDNDDVSRNIPDSSL